TALKSAPRVASFLKTSMRARPAAVRITCGLRASAGSLASAAVRACTSAFLRAVVAASIGRGYPRKAPRRPPCYRFPHERDPEGLPPDRRRGGRPHQGVDARRPARGRGGGATAQRREDAVHPPLGGRDARRALG